ncbi:hypothetical protein LRB11_15840 [Ectothiorhodospira haloalkaliphila]|uniref:hypothetical protein n=1 Tax=Ectothiorhodospira haloalkaliphila TaxID=421628 RepID=UPI001EE8D655|nr:hypothetical protein [Ectothiorhodospira haloalkaliphila]MCG5526383.1 hypothetical protein [Ectothiorhodospira haloalkaliphila]
MRVEIWGSQVHVVDLVAGTLLLIVAGFLLWSVWAIRRKGLRRYWGGVSKASVATMGVSIAILGAVFQMLGVVAKAILDALGRSDSGVYYAGLEPEDPSRMRIDPPFSDSNDKD